MAIGADIYNKLITDFEALTFGSGNACFARVKKYYLEGAMNSGDALLLPDANTEVTTGQSAGNTQTTREYQFRLFTVETIEGNTDDEVSIQYDRLLNRGDAVLDYLQKEPSNLNSWGASNNIEIYKIRHQPYRFDVIRDKSGYVALLDIPFTVYLNIVPQNL